MFPGIFYNLGRLLGKNFRYGLGAAALCALVMLRLPFGLDTASVWITWIFAWAFALFEAGLTVYAAHMWAALAAEKVHANAQTKVWPVAILGVSFSQVLLSVYILAFRVEHAMLAMICGIMSVAVIVHNIVAEKGVIVAGILFSI